jgi:HAD superfamily hydrolase (TIGR01509 family)
VAGSTYSAVIFDLDGVLWDGEPPHRRAFDEVLASYDHRVRDEDYIELLGTSVEFTWEWVRDRFRLTISAGDFWDAYSAAFLRLLQGSFPPLSGVRALIDELRQRAVPIAVASSSLREWVDATLSAIGLSDSFDAVVSGNDVNKGKPAPDLFLAAAERLGVPPERCLAVEDTLAGARSAKAAGMFAIQLRAASTALPPIGEADLVLDDFSQLELSLLGEPAREARS